MIAWIRNWLTASIARQFAAAMLVVAFATGGLLGGVFISHEWRHLRDEISRTFADTAFLTGQRIEGLLDGAANDATELARNPLIGNALVDSGGRDAYLAPFLRTYKSSGRMPVRISLYDFQGISVASNMDRPPPPVGGEPWFIASLSGKVTAAIGDGAILMAFPVIFASTGQSEGVFTAEISASVLLARALSRPDDGLTMVKIEAGDSRTLAAVGGVVATDTLSFSRPLTVESPLDQLGLRLTLHQDEARAYAPLRTFFVPFLAVGVFASALALALAYYASRRLAGPLKALSAAAITITDDISANPSLLTEGRDEVARLGSALAAMLMRLRDARHTLESRVEERTAELRAAEETLRFQASRLAAILENVVDGIITIDEKGIVLSVNPATERLFGWSAADMLGRNVSMLMPEPHRSAHDGYLRNYLTTGHSRIIGIGRQVEGRRRDGTTFPLDLAVSIVRMDDRTVFIGVVRDITERIQTQMALLTAKEEAETANQAKSEFLAVMSHEIRTPLNGVLGTLGIMLDNELSGEQRRLAEVAQRSGQSLLSIINDILDFSKMEAGKLDLSIGNIELRRLVRDVVEMVEPAASRKGLTIEVTLDPALPPWLRGDKVRLRQILANLAGNAVKFTEAGQVHIAVASVASVAASPSVLRFAVTDTGMGISKADQARLFTRFTQVESSLTRKYGGTGLGLAICRRLVGLMGGEIGVDSEPGRGSTFWFTVALPPGEAEAEALSPEPASAAASASVPRAGGRLLLAEDSEANRLVATTILRRAGHTVDTVENGADAVEAVQTRAYDLVLMDVAMPGMDGLQATKLIRGLPPPLGRLPIIAMTAFAMRGDADMCLAAGMDGYLSKPVDPAALLAEVSRWLGRTAPAGETAVAATVGAQGLLDEAAIATLVEGTDLDTVRVIAGKVAEEMWSRAARLAEATQRGDVDAVGREAHTLKSLASTFGAGDLTSLARSIEEGCRAGDAGVLSQVDALRALTNSVATALRVRFEPGQSGEVNTAILTPSPPSSGGRGPG
ncbi:MAG: PAS domain S-box protein [Alphaproteobacteria bacterium]